MSAIEAFDAVDLIRAKRDGRELETAEIDWLIDAYTRGYVADEQMSAMTMAIFLNGMSRREIAAQFEPRDPANDKMAMTGEAVKQHLAKLRKHRAKQGFRVPPKLDRNARRNASNVQAARLASALHTPTSTPKKKKRSGDSAAKPSTLLASVSKTKQKKAEKAKKAAAGVTKSSSAKHGRKTTIEYVNGKRRVMVHLPLYSIGGPVKSEEQSDDASEHI